MATHDSASTKPGAWWQVSLEVPKNWADDASASLIDAGALGVQSIDDSVEVQPGHSVQKPSDPTLTLLIACYGAEAEGATLVAQVVAAVGELGLHLAPETVQIRRRETSDWGEAWKQFFKPLKIGRRMWVVPTWDRDFKPPTHSVVLQVDPGMAFGTGQHATTALCLRGVEFYADAMAEATRPQTRVLDLGCGSGLLAIGAAKLGLGHVLAVDNDPVAVQATVENVAQNGVDTQVRVSGAPIDEVQESFDLVVANILAAPLVELAPALVSRLQAGGTLILSGLLIAQADAVIQAYARAAKRAAVDLTHTHRWTHGEWVALGFARRSPNLQAPA